LVETSTVVAAVPIVPPVARLAIAVAENAVDPLLWSVAIGEVVPIP